MLKTLDALFKKDRGKYTVPRKVQDVIPIKQIWSDGIFMVDDKFAKTYQFKDINYFAASNEDKKKMFLSYANIQKLEAGILIKPKGRPRSNGDALPPSIQQLSKLTQLQYELARKERELKRLEMENELLRDFLLLTERK